MSAPDEEQFSQENMDRVWELAAEPSYISEIARKLRMLYDEWESVTHLTAVSRVAKMSLILSRGSQEFLDVTGQIDMGGQAESSPKISIGPVEEDTGELESRIDVDEVKQETGSEVTTTWQDYRVVFNTAIDESEIREEILDVIDTEVGLEEKLDVIKKISKKGNEVSKDAERILQDVLERQFRHYDRVESTDYNNPGPDFIVHDERNREYGLAVEISVRWVNPIDKAYVESKKSYTVDNDMDLVILAPRYRNNVIREYEDPDNPDWHSGPFSRLVHTHRLPTDRNEVYKPFVKNKGDLEENDNRKGNPIIVSDSEKLSANIDNIGNVGDGYPIVDSDYNEFRRLLDSVGRIYNVVPESTYRNSIRESIEPLLWEFLRPYKIEQFLIDMYWDKGLSQSEVGRLVSRSGGTIGKWMRDWGIIRRGTGAPELSDEVKEIWRRMYEGEDPFPSQFSGYRIQAEYNRHPQWGLDDWRQWYNDTTEEERKDVIAEQGSYRNNISYTIMTGVTDRLQPSYTFIISVLKDMGVDVREPDEAPRVPYNAYPSKDALEYMLNKNQDTIVDVSE